MAPDWRRKWSRLTHMSWDEAHDRIGQEVAKRLDLALYRTCLGPRTPQLQPGPTVRPNFFFQSDGDDVTHRAALLREHLPQEAENIVYEADDICRHQFHLLGYEKIDYGPNIDWHSDPIHGKHSPLQPWFKINFLDFPQVGDHKIIWELNRHQHLVTLAKAWRLSGNSLYTKELLTQWYSWQKENPYPIGINWASSLEAAFRSLSWLWIRNLLGASLDLPSAFQTDLLLALQLHGRYIERHLSTYFSPNTHLIGEAVALLFIGILCPEISASQRWQDKGWKIVLAESQRQIRPGGVYFEQSLYYHVYALDFFLHARILASNNGRAIPEEFDQVLKRMLDVIQALSANGPAEGFGDDDGGRVFIPRRNLAEHMTDPLALGAVLYDRDRYAAARLTEESIWLFGDSAIATLGKQPKSQPTAASQAFTQSGIYLINDKVPFPQQMMIDAGPQGTGRSGHGHADALSIRLSLDGQRFLVDPGAYCYISDDGERNGFRGTGAHNTLRVDKLDQAVPSGPFAWDSIPNVRGETWLNGETFDFFAGSHDGYCRLPEPVLHRREIFHVKSGLWFFRDVAEGQGKHLLESFWHFAPELAVTQEHGGIFASSPIAENNRGALVMLTDRNSAWTTEIREGYVSSAYGSKQPAPVVRLKAEVVLPEDCAVLLLPTTHLEDIGFLAAFGERPLSGVRGYRYQTLRGTEILFFAPGNIPWDCGVWSSDAAVLYCKLAGGRLEQVIMVSGSFAEWRGSRFISRPEPAAAFEWSNLRDLSQDSFSASNRTSEGVVSEFEFNDSL